MIAEFGFTFAGSKKNYSLKSMQKVLQKFSYLLLQTILQYCFTKYCYYYCSIFISIANNPGSQ